MEPAKSLPVASSQLPKLRVRRTLLGKRRLRLMSRSPDLSTTRAEASEAVRDKSVSADDSQSNSASDETTNAEQVSSAPGNCWGGVLSDSPCALLRLGTGPERWNYRGGRNIPSRIRCQRLFQLSL